MALTEADPMSVDELILQEAGRDLRPDVVTPDPDMSLAVDPAAVQAAAEEALSSSETVEESDRPSEEVAATSENQEDEKQ